MSENQNSLGGLGGDRLVTPLAGARDVRLLERAIREKWNLRPEYFENLPEEMYRVAMDPMRSDKAKIAAVRSIMAMHGQNHEDDKPEGDQHVHLHADLSRVSTADLEDLERRFLDLIARSAPADLPGGTGEAQLLQVREGGVGPDGVGPVPG
jgi:hypothetical protein